LGRWDDVKIVKWAREGGAGEPFEGSTPLSGNPSAVNLIDYGEWFGSSGSEIRVIEKQRFIAGSSSSGCPNRLNSRALVALCSGVMKVLLRGN